jgi:peptide chain release factor subunit 1
MGATVSWDGLRELAAFRAVNGCAISVFVDLDPSVTPTAGDLATRVNALVDDGLRRVGNPSSNLTHAQRQALREDLERIDRYFRHEFSREGSRGAAIFAAGLDNIWKPLSLAERVPDRVEIGREFHLAPLVSLVGRGDGALVAVVGRERGNVYRLEGGRLQELVDHTEEQPFKRHDQGGWSQANYQRHVDHLAESHLRRVAAELDRRVRRQRIPRVVIVGSEEARAELDDLLSNTTKGALAGWTHADAHASPTELLRVVEPVLEAWREREERRALERWQEERGRDGRAAAGWRETLEAASDGRVEMLLFAERADLAAWQCPDCGRASVDGGSCPLDGVRMEPQPNGLDLAVHQTLRHGGTVWALRHHQDLDEFDGIGALLRY